MSGPFRALTPCTEQELMGRAAELCGMTVGTLAEQLGRAMKEGASQLHRKGGVGELVEQYLGVPDHSAAGPDFPALGIEVKTLPLSDDGRPSESTYVCALSFREVDRAEWLTSRARSKLCRVLWVPVQARAGQAVAARRLGEPFLWSPSAQVESVLRADWEEIVGAVAAGDVEGVTAHMGTYLQLRPKAANASVRSLAPAPDGSVQMHNPRGFYLRTSFTRAIVANAQL